LDDTDGWCTGRRTRSQATGANERQPLDDHNDSIGNEQRRHPSDAISAQPERRRSARRKVQPTVQTTLNISSRAAFSECRICDTVWNPMYPDDVKYHVKRHQAVVRAKRKREDSIL
jgi:hypothetical protein